MSTTREGHLPVDGAELYFRETGDGDAVVVLHGGPDFNHRYLLPDLDALARDFRLIYYDQRGRGRSSAGVAAHEVSIASEVDDLDRVREYFELDTMTLLGHSWGGVLAMEYATRNPERVSHLVLLNTAPASRADSVLFQRHRVRNDSGDLATMRSIARTPGYMAGNTTTEAEYYRAHFRATVRRPEQLDAIIANLRTDFTPDDVLRARAIEERLYAQTWETPGYDLLPALRSVDTPALVVHGEHDFVPVECAKHVAGAIKNAQLVVLKDCGHFSYMEQPAAVLDAIKTFIARGVK